MASSVTYEKLDQPEVLALIFHPRREDTALPAGAVDHDIEVEPGVVLGGRFFMVDDPGAANILFFHGNGEVVSDYDDIGPQFNEQGMNFLAVDYRGYGRSSGSPTVTSMISDAHLVLADVKKWLAAQGRTGSLVVMGRSLGSVPAIDLAANNPEVKALIVESGIAQTMPLLLNLGVDVQALGITEADGFGNLQKVATVLKPSYFLHAHLDQIIPVDLAAGLHSMCGAASKEFQTIPGADHNNIFERTGKLYFQAIQLFVRKIGMPMRRKKPGIR
ncbi:MAG: alpha/beta hydrolase [Desulfobulbaceae bacterium]|nr:alpha/beta hydrolase [Desulfobulbaceae bacterium]